jgi:hypothetical protein
LAGYPAKSVAVSTRWIRKLLFPVLTGSTKLNARQIKKV